MTTIPKLHKQRGQARETESKEITPRIIKDIVRQIIKIKSTKDPRLHLSQTQAEWSKARLHLT